MNQTGKKRVRTYSDIRRRKGKNVSGIVWRAKSKVDHAGRKNHEYLDSYGPVRLVSSCRTTMRSDCYCNTCVPIAQQREEIHSERSRMKSSKSSFAKTETVRSAKKISLTPAKVIDDEQMDDKGSLYPVSLILSPETSAAIEDVEKLIKDAEIQIKEISMATSARSFKRASTDIYESEAPLDDENDQLLYIRERVTYKFQEVNGCIDSYCTSSKSQQFLREGDKKSIDLFAPKFQTSEDRYRKFSQRRKHRLKQLDLLPDSNDKTRHNDETGSACTGQENGGSRKITNCSIQSGPSIDIKGEMITQNLESIHISPDPCFVQESQNVGTYVFYRDFFTENAPPKRKEKFVRIPGGSNDNKKDGTISANDEQMKKHAKKSNESEADGVDLSQAFKKTEKYSVRSRDVSTEIDEGALLNITRGKEEPLSRNYENKESLEDNDDESKDRSTEKSLRNVSNGKQVSVTNQEDQTIKLASKNEQKQVRFDEEALRTEDNKSHVDESRGEGEDGTILKENLNVPSKSIAAEESQSILKNNTVEFKHPSPLKSVKTDDKHAVLLLTKKIEDKRAVDKKRRREVCRDRRTKKDEHYSMIDERFTNIFKNYCDQEERCRKNDSPSIVISSVDSSEDSEELYDFRNLYEPCINELDIVLGAYNKVIENVVQSTRTIDKFLSQEELEEYYVEAAKQSVDSVVPLNRKKIQVNVATNNDESRSLYMKQSRNARRREKIVRDHVSNNGSKKPGKHIKFEEKELQRNPDKYSVRTDLRTSNRLIGLRRSDREDIVRSYKDSKRNTKTMKPDIAKQICPFETSLYRVENESSSLSNLSMCPASLSTDNGLDNDAKMLREITETSIDEQFVHGESLNLKLNAIETEGGNFDYATFHNILRSNILTDVFGKMKNAVRGETQFIEDEIKKIFNIKEIAPLIMRTLLESSKNDLANLETFELLFAKKVPTDDVTPVHDIRTANTPEPNSTSEKRNLQLEYPPNERNAATRVIKCDEEIVEENITHVSQSDQNVIIDTNGENVPILEIIRINSVESLKENSITKSGTERNDKNITSQDDEVNLQPKGSSNENLSSTRNASTAVIEQSEESCQLIDALKTSTSLEENGKRTSREIDAASHEIDKIITKKCEEKSDNSTQKESIKSNGKLSISSSKTISKTREEKIVKSHSAIENTGKTENNLPHVSLSDSLHDCASLRSSSRNLSKTTSNDMNSSQNINDVERIISSRIQKRITQIDNSYFDNAFEKERILSDVYNQIYKKFDTNYLNDPHQRTSCTDISTISTEESNKSEALSDPWQSEGELCMPHFGSYSLGEVRILRNDQNQSEGENTDDTNLDDSITDFVTEKILDSCDESLKIK